MNLRLLGLNLKTAKKEHDESENAGDGGEQASGYSVNRIVVNIQLGDLDVTTR